MRNKVLLTIAATLTSASAALAQTPDTTGIYNDRQDSLQAAVFTGRQDGNFLSRGKELRTEVILSSRLTGSLVILPNRLLTGSIRSSVLFITDLKIS